MDLWRVKAYCYSHIFSVFWGGCFLVGGAVFLVYYAGIRYIPSFDLMASVSFIVAASITPALIVLISLCSIVAPGICWREFWGERSLIRMKWEPVKGKPLKELVGVFVWFCLPSLLLSLTFVLMFFSNALYAAFAFCFFCVFGVLAWRYTEGNVAAKIKECLAMSAASLAVSIFLFMAFMLVLVFFKEGGGGSGVADYIILGIVVVFVLLLNVMSAARPKTNKRWLWYLGVGGYGVFVIFFATKGFVFLPDLVMQVYKFGNLEDVSIVLDKEGCDILQANSVELVGSFDAWCKKEGVYVFSRIGEESFLRVEGVEFIINNERILSWGFPRDKME